MKKALVLMFLAGGLIGCAVQRPVATAHQSHLDAADTLATDEPAELREVYRAGNRFFSRGKLDRALIEYDYAAYDGSAAAMLRLCILHAHDDWGLLDPPRALFWCNQSARRGYRPAAQIATYLFNTYWQEE